MAEPPRQPSERRGFAPVSSFPPPTRGSSSILGVVVRQRPGMVLITLTGEFDMAGEDRFTEALAALDDRPAEIIIDLRDLEFIDARGVALILEQRRRANEIGRAVGVVLGDGLPRRLFDLLGLNGGLIREAPGPEFDRPDRIATA